MKVKSDRNSPTSKSAGKAKHKKKKAKEKHKTKHKKSRKNDRSSSSSSSDDEEAVWVEKTAPRSPSGEQDLSNTLEKCEPPKREDWMSLDTLFPCVSNEPKPRKGGSINRQGNANQCILDKPGQSSKELNPYWKNGGDGLPQTDSFKTNTEQVMDAKWLKKSLQRAQEQALTEGRPLEEIAAERWGSLEVLQSMIAKAETKYSGRSNPKHRSESRPWRREQYEEKRHYLHRNEDSTSDSRDRHERYRRDSNSPNAKREKQSYRKPTDDDCFTNASRRSHQSRAKNWQKQRDENKSVDSQERKTSSTSDFDKSEIAPDPSSDTKNEEVTALTEAEMNKLGARIVKAEIMGDTKLAAELKIRLEKSRELAVKPSTSQRSETVENVILTRTDAKGVTRPLEPRGDSRESSSTSKRRKNVQTHVSGERVRHYFDDDKYSLDQLFQHEKGRSANEDDAVFARIASKNMDDVFEEQISRAQSNERRDNRDRMVAINEHKRFSKSLDSCQWCLDSKHMLKHMIVSMDSEICLSLPSHASLTEGHCILTPVQHTACQLQLDENVWEKLKAFKRALYKMFAAEDRYPVFFEIYKSRYKFPHMRLECVPLPKEIGESAPMYFKKALLECETEWSINKKVVDLSSKDVRRAIPNGLSYFAVEFEGDKGYAHVIEDEEMFPKNFAEEIIGGMLDLDHDLWRKFKREDFDSQREKVLKFSEVWKKYKSVDCQ